MKRTLLGAVLVALGLLVPSVAGAQTTTTTVPPTTSSTTTTTAPPLVYTIPPSIDSTCANNVTGKLNDFFASLPSGATVSLGNAQSCYQSNGVLAIRDKNLQIEGNGATINAPKAGTPAVAGTQPHPIILFAKANDSSLNNVNINGALNPEGTNGGVKYEHYLGIETVSTKNLTLNGVNLANIQGDGLAVQFPVTSAPINVSGNMLNKNILIENSSIKKCGWVAISITSVDGFRMTNSTIGKAVDSIDMEYNLYSSQITDTGQARFAAMNNILFDHDKFQNWSAVWFVTKNGQTKCQHHPTRYCKDGGGVQQRNVTLEDNQLSASAPLVDVLGTNPAWTTEPYINQGLTIINNTNSKDARSLHGGAPTTPHAGPAMRLKYVTNVTISGNHFPIYHGHPGYFENTPYTDALKPNNVDSLTLTYNNFFGALSVTYGGGGNTNVTRCQNEQGLSGETDGECPISVLPPS